MLVLLLLCAWTEPPAAVDAEVRQVAAWMTGHFTSAAQAQTDRDYFAVDLHMVPLWPDRNDGIWLYVEQALASARDKPYRQRVYRLYRQKQGEIISAVYVLPGDPLRFAGGWQEAGKFAGLRPEDLIERVGCHITLHKQPDGHFAGATTGKSCASDLRGASYATSSVVLTATTLKSWDQGFDQTGKQVWGATKGPYVFVKRPEPK